MSLKGMLGANARQFGMIFALIALIIFFQWQTGGLTLTPDNVINLFNGNSYILILAIGMVLVIIAGHIDLSVGSIAAAVGIVVAIAMRDWGLSWWAGVLLGLVIGAVIGALAGLLGRLHGHPGVHRDPRRHADLPRYQPDRRRVQHRPGAPRLPVPRGRVPARDRS